MSYLSQMVGPGLAQFRLGGRRHRDRDRGDPRRHAHRSQDDRQLLGRPDPHAALRPCCRSASSSRCCSAGRACRRTSSPITTSTTLEGVKQSITERPDGLARDHQGTRAPTAAASSTRTPPRPTRIRRRFRNLLEMLAIFLIPARADVHVRPMRQGQRQGWALFAAMAMLFVAGVRRARTARSPSGNPIVHAARRARRRTWRAKSAASASPPRRCSRPSRPTRRAARSTRCTTRSRRWAASCRWSTCNSARSSSAASARGLYGMIVFVVLTVFIAGLMVGRTPEYLGKKIERREVQLAILAILVAAVLRARSDRVAVLGPAGLATLGNNGAHGFSEILYVFTSTTENNGSAFARPGGEHVLQRHDRHRDALRPLLHSSFRRSRWPARWPARKPCRRPPGRSDRRRRSSSCCCSASSSSSAR